MSNNRLATTLPNSIGNLSELQILHSFDLFGQKGAERLIYQLQYQLQYQRFFNHFHIIVPMAGSYFKLPVMAGYVIEKANHLLSCTHTQKVYMQYLMTKREENGEITVADVPNF